MISCSQLS